MNKLLIALATAGATALAAGTASAAQLSQQDQTFLKNAAMDNLAEIQTAQMVMQKTNSPQVKQLAQTLIQDHEKLSTELQQVAQKDGVTLPSQLNDEEKQEMQQMSQLQGKQLDQKFLQEQVQDHREDIQTFQKEANSTQNPQVKQLTEQAIPVLQKHLQMAEQAQQSLGQGNAG